LKENIIIITKKRKKYPFPHRQNLTIGLLERRGVCRSNIGPPAIESTNESARHCALPPRAPIAIAPLKILKMGDILEPGIWEEKEGSRRGPIYNTRIWLTDLLRPAILTRGRGGKQHSISGWPARLRSISGVLAPPSIMAAAEVYDNGR